MHVVFFNIQMNIIKRTFSADYATDLKLTWVAATMGRSIHASVRCKGLQLVIVPTESRIPNEEQTMMHRKTLEEYTFAYLGTDHKENKSSNPIIQYLHLE